MIMVTVWGRRKDKNYFNVVTEVNSNSNRVSKDHILIGIGEVHVVRILLRIGLEITRTL
jgi:hypothetical protein